MFERSALKWLVFEFSQVCIKLRKSSGLCPPTFQPLSKIESSKGAVPVGQTHPRMTSSFSGSTEVCVWERGGGKEGPNRLQTPKSCWVQLQWCILVFKIDAQPSWSEAQQAADWKILPWTLTQTASGGGCVAIPRVPGEYAVTYLLYFSRSQRQAPPVLMHPPHPPHLFLLFLWPGYGTVLSLCLQADRHKLNRL